MGARRARGCRRGRGLTATGLARPPEPRQLRDFPTVRTPAHLHRLSDHLGSPWWFSSLPPTDGGGRFDLPAPRGTCYLADELEGALLEKLLRRPKRVLPVQRLRELFHARVTVTSPPLLADLTSARASSFGVNAEIHTALEYELPRAWAEALHRARHRGLRYALRSDPALRQRAVALFGGAGLHARAPAGMRTRVTPLDLPTAAGILARRGIVVAPIPQHVGTVEVGPRRPR